MRPVNYDQGPDARAFVLDIVDRVPRCQYMHHVGELTPVQAQWVSRHLDHLVHELMLVRTLADHRASGANLHTESNETRRGIALRVERVSVRVRKVLGYVPYDVGAVRRWLTMEQPPIGAPTQPEGTDV